MDRRDFIKTSFAVGYVAGMSFVMGRKSNLYAGTKQPYDLVAIKGTEPDKLFDLGIKAYGGIKKFVKKGQTVVIKPNIGWNKGPEYASNTNPKLIKRIVEHCKEAGASKIFVFDHTCENWESAYKSSGLQKVVKDGGGIMVPGNSSGYYQEVSNPKGGILKNVKVHELILESDVFINVPVLKHHGGARLTIAMKNLMGVVWDRRFYHSNGLHQCISDFCHYRKPDLNIVDAYSVMMKNGPRGVSLEDVVIKKSQLISTDIVAIDAAASKIFGKEPEEIPYIQIAHKSKLGNKNLSELNIKRISA